jgi:two-component system response regulator PilR (NtrC family)
MSVGASRPILGRSSAVTRMISLIQRVAPTKTNVLIIGESGTGKELVARMIHESGPLKEKAFVPVNCGAIPETLIESEMFGHRRGSFTGAVSDKIGLFEAAHGGTLFLDEVGELPLAMQVKLLRAIQERVFKKVGGTEDIKVDVRIIAATNRDLEAAIAKGTFREDLYYRLNVIQIPAPPLREREGDVKLLAEAFLSKFAKKFGKSVSTIAADAMAALEAWNWPGNIRELENVLERAVALEEHGSLELGSLPAMIADAWRSKPKSKAESGTTASGSEGRLPGRVRVEGGSLLAPPPVFSGAGKFDLDGVLAEIERVYLEAALAKSGGRRKNAAELLGITAQSLRYRIEKQGLAGGE